jgi:REP element-mobilizing transposase RayT
MAEERRQIELIFKGDTAKARSSLGALARRHFAVLESWLDRATIGPTWLADARVADLVAEALRYRDGKTYRLDAYSIMPNHVHSVFMPLARNNEPKPLASIMHSLKRNTARRANLVLDRSGPFWEHESFDHYIRNRAEWKRIMKYVLENPVKAGLVKNWKDWPWNYLRSPPGKPDAN